MRHQQKCNPCFQDEPRCANNGTCRALSVDKYTCDCLPAYYGSRCEQVVDGCFDKPCKNQGLCQALANGRFQCTCQSGYTGNRCEIDIDDCHYHRCSNNATCIDQVNGYTCQCQMAFTGKNKNILSSY